MRPLRTRMLKVLVEYRDCDFTNNWLKIILYFSKINKKS
jgi:hypothetical protein